MSYPKREQPECKALASSGCLYCVGDAEAKVEVFERNREARQHPQEREECFRRGHNKNLENQYNVSHLPGSKM